MKQLNQYSYDTKQRPVKILQFGEGNFLRAFVDWIIQDLNDKGTINTNVAVVQPMPVGRVDNLAEQDGLYTVCLEGIDNGHKTQSRQIIDVLGDFINPFTQYDKYLAYAESDELEVVISNTTEAGIALNESDVDFSSCPKSFPGKVLALLEKRYRYFNGDESKGLAFVPCELIDHNGSELKRVLNQLAVIRRMDDDFIAWLNNANHFTDTLVDCIVPGYPRDTAEQIWQETGLVDNNVVKAEVFHLWVLKKDEFIQQRFPADSTGLNVLFVEDIAPYKQRKVKVLNGAHTSMMPIAYLCGIDTVGESVNDNDVGEFITQLVNKVIKPTIALPEDQLDAFAVSVMERFKNPFIRHELMSIALNTTTKFRTRLLPTYNDYVAKFGTAPKHILFAFASMAVFYRGKRGEQDIALNDDKQYLDFWKQVWTGANSTIIAQNALGCADVWGQNLATDSNVEIVASYIEDIITNGMRIALQHFLNR